MTGNRVPGAATGIRVDIAGLIDEVPICHDTTARRYALDAGIQVGAVTSRRPYRVDSAELIGFIHNQIADGWPDDVSAAGLADAIVDRFNLDEEN